MYEIINGKALAQKTRDMIAAEVATLPSKPKLVVVLVGDDPASQVYVASKEKFAVAIGMESQVIRLDASTTQAELVQVVDGLNNDPSVNGLLVQFPLPDHISESHIMNIISPQKDVDGLNTINVGRLVSGNATLMPCTPSGIIRLIESTGVDICGKSAVIIGRSMLVGKPVAMMLLHRHATVTICHSRTNDIAAQIRSADIVVAAVGIPNFVKADMVKDGAIVIDVGINRVNKKLVGDVDFEAVKEKASHITPVPGGVGPMTISMLLMNTVTAYKSQHNL